MDYELYFAKLDKPLPYALVQHNNKRIIVNVHERLPKWRRTLAFIHECLHIIDRINGEVSNHFSLHLTSVALLVYLIVSEESVFKDFVRLLVKVDTKVDDEDVKELKPIIQKVASFIFKGTTDGQRRATHSYKA